MTSKLERRIAALENVRQSRAEVARVVIFQPKATDGEVQAHIDDVRRAYPEARVIFALPDNGRNPHLRQ